MSLGRKTGFELREDHSGCRMEGGSESLDERLSHRETMAVWLRLGQSSGPGEKRTGS